MSTDDTRNKRRDEIRNRVASLKDAYPRCIVLDCNQPTMAYARQGLNKDYCRRHVEHYRRHGSYSKPSYLASELRAYRRRAYAWLQAHADRPEVNEAVDRVRTLYWRAGRPEEAFRLSGKAPSERAKFVWGRLNERKVSPASVLSVWIAVSLRHSHDPQPERRIEYRLVQAAKLLHRMAGGSHKKWETPSHGGAVAVVELHKHPASKGRALRHVGAALARAADPLGRLMAEIDVQDD